MPTTLRIPYTQQFSPAATPIRALVGILRQHKGKRADLRQAIASAFHKKSTSPEKMAGNTVISLKAHGIITEDAALTQLGRDLVNASTDDEAIALIARNLLQNLDCLHLVETLREMKTAGLPMTLPSITAELRTRGIEASDNSSDLSGVLGWLRAAGVLDDYKVNEARYTKLLGTTPPTIDALKGMTRDQIAFLRALVALSPTDFIANDKVIDHAAALYAGDVAFDRKTPDRPLLKPLVAAGFIETKPAPKRVAESRGGKSTLIKPTAKFEAEIAEPILAPIYKTAGFRDVRMIRSYSLETLVANVKQKTDEDLRAKSLEFLAIRICQLLDLVFMGWRETDEALAAGGEVDGFMHTARLVYSRWQIQCKASDKVTMETLAKEVGVAEVTLANVILVVSTGTVTSGAETYRRKITAKSPLNIVIIDGKDLNRIVKDPGVITEILRHQAEDAMQIKPAPDQLTRKAPASGGNGDDDGGGKGGPGGGKAPPTDSGKAGTPGSRADEPLTLFQPDYSTGSGSMYLGDAHDVLRFLIRKGVRVKLLFTSPPFALIRKKAYKNEDQERYVDWFMRFAPLFHQVLEPDGSFVMDIGGSWLPGMPVRSVYQYKLLLRLCESGFYLAQEFYHYNPARLPTPAEWVTVRRMRVKDAMNNVWWFVKEPFVDSDNRRVLREYSDSMKKLIRNGYKAALRPSGHQISKKFNVDRGGSIPSNLLEFANTDSQGYYLRECKRNGIPPHPARFPLGLPAFFIRFLTAPGDLVLDPFAGSNVTGAAAEKLGRQWIGIELKEEYVKGSKFRFDKPEAPSIAGDDVSEELTLDFDWARA